MVLSHNWKDSGFEMHRRFFAMLATRFHMVTKLQPPSRFVMVTKLQPMKRFLMVTKSTVHTASAVALCVI